MQELLSEVLKKSGAYYCLDCGKCTGICPVAQNNHSFSPRNMLTRTLYQNSEGLLKDYNLWSCLTCRRCDLYCPQGIDYINVIQTLRILARKDGFAGKCSHAGALESMQRIMTAPELKQNRLDWLTKEVKVASQGEVLFFVGCSPYFDVFFADLNLDLTRDLLSTIQILNHLGIKPVLLKDERCCGHDLFWNGDLENFKMLAGINKELIQQSGASTVVFNCAECLSTFKNLYPEYGFSLKADLMHISEFLEKKRVENGLKLNSISKKVTYHDACRLGRHIGVYDSPRNLLRNASDFVEVNPSGKKSLCCGVSGWMNCDVSSKTLQVKRLRQVAETGAEILAVTCPKCKIHFTCTRQDKKIKAELNFEILGFSEIIQQSIIN